VASSAPDVREERIAELKRRIQSGSYQMDPNAIADKMVTEHLKTGGA
jgi:flagellar biosynthesis anti-sigma factor FlgM